MSLTDDYEDRENELIKEIAEWTRVAERKYKEGFDEGLKQGEDIGRCNTLERVREAIENKKKRLIKNGLKQTHAMMILDDLLKELGIEKEA
jgi:flagellar biosynthesis/type III secretory pathway protein FliH